MNNAKTYMALMVGCAALAGCAPQSTPSMVNTSRVELVSQGLVDQVPLGEVNEGYLSMLASQYGRYGEGPVGLMVSYDPASKSFDATNAARELKTLKDKMGRKGLNNVWTTIMPVEGQAAPMLMVSYDTVIAQSPSDCGAMQGLYDKKTSRDIGDYRFGCGVEQMLSRQVSRPADLKGRGTADPADGRRATNVSEAYIGITAEQVREPLEALGRDDIAD